MEVQIEQGQSGHEQLIEAAREGRGAEFLGSLPKLTAAPPSDPQFYVILGKGIQRGKLTDAAHDPLILTIRELMEAGKTEEATWLVSGLATVFPRSEDLRTAAADALKTHHAQTPSIEIYVKSAKLDDKQQTLEDGLKRFRALMRLSPGRVYRHNAWGDGVVQRVDFKAARLIIDFPEEKGKALAFDAVKKFLQYFAPDHVVAIRATDIERLRGLAQEDPAALVKLCLESYGGEMKQGELKQILVKGIVAEEKWTTWWSKTKIELRLDAMVDFDEKGGAHAMLALRDEPKTLAEEIEELFFAEDSDINAFTGALARLADHVRKSREEPNGDLAKRMLARIVETWEKTHAEAALDRLRLSLLTEQLLALAPKSAGLSWPKNIEEPATAVKALGRYEELAEINDADQAIRALELLIKRDGKAEAERRMAQLFPHAGIKLAQAIWKEFQSLGDTLIAVKAVHALLERPLENPQTFFWAVKAIVDGGWEHLEDHFSSSSVVVDLLSGLDDWQLTIEKRPGTSDAAAAKQLVAKVRQLLQSDSFRPLTEAAKEMSAEEFAEFKKSVTTNSTFNDAFRRGAERAFVSVRADAMPKQQSRAQAQAALDENKPHFCTAAAQEEKLKELEHLRDVVIPANATEIEVARSQGDLRENAGYHGARERHALLLSQKDRLERDISLSRVFDFSTLDSSVVGFGTEFVATNTATNEDERFIVLGRFEADPSKSRYSYQTPFIQSFMGKKTGDTVNVQFPGGGSGTYVVKSIAKAKV